MRKLESDIKRATKNYENAKAKYEEARDAYEYLVELKEVERMDEQGVKPNLINVMYYGAYLNGIQRACAKIIKARANGGWGSMDYYLTINAK